MVDVREQEGNELVAVPHDGQTSTEMGVHWDDISFHFGTHWECSILCMKLKLLLPLMRDEKITIIHWKTTRTYLAQRTRKSPNSQTKKQALTNESSKPLDN